MKRILVVNVNWIGDVIFSVPVFRALKNAYPQAHVACLVVPRVKDVAESCPFIDEVIIYDEKGADYFPWAKIRLIWRLRQKHFDAAFLLHRSWTRAFHVFLAGIPIRVGYDTKGRGNLLTHRISLPETPLHRADFYLRVVEDYGISVPDRSYELSVAHQSREQITNFLQKNGVGPEEFLLVVHVGANWELKRWPKEQFALLIKGIMEKWPVKVVIPGTIKDERLAREIADLSHHSPLVAAGKTDLKQLLALLQRAQLVISADSGPLHMANAVGTDVIALFGPTRPEITGPRGQGRAFVLQKDMECNQEPCYNLRCPDSKCMKMITVEDVLEAFSRYWQEYHSPGFKSPRRLI